MRKIIHIDMDCFFAAVEMRDNPEFRGIPLAIGGRPGSRGVIATANYEARKYGVRSAMSSAMALRKCPKLVLIGGNMNKYKEASQIIRKIFYKYTDLVQPLSLDEAYLDVTQCLEFKNSATIIAKKIRDEIFLETGLTASAGVAPNKFLAKVASDWNKPNGQKVITPNEVKEFVKDLDVKLINGVGKVTALKLEKLGIKKCYHIENLGLRFMETHFNKFGHYLYNLSLGIDDRLVNTDSKRKSLSVEQTFNKDIESFDQWNSSLMKVLEELNIRLKQYKIKKSPNVKIDKITIKLKYYDFKSVTIQKKLDETFLSGLWDKHIICTKLREFVSALLNQAFENRDEPIRLIGIGATFKQLELENELQLPLFYP